MRLGAKAVATVAAVAAAIMLNLCERPPADTWGSPAEDNFGEGYKDPAEGPRTWEANPAESAGQGGARAEQTAPPTKGFVWRLNATTGAYEMAEVIGRNATGNHIGKAIACAPDGVIVAGNFTGSMSIGGIGLESTEGSQDIYIAKFMYPVIDIYPPGRPGGMQIWRAEGNDVVLLWDEVTQDVRGNPIAVDIYRIYASSEPSETLSDYTLVGETSGTSWRHVGILGREGRQFYKVVAVYMP